MVPRRYLGVFAMLAFQMIENIGMSLGLLPIIGITLPFFSAGGSSMIAVFAGIGLVLSVYRSSQFRKPVDVRVGNLYTPFTENF